MRPPKTLCWLILVAMTPQLTGCTSFRVIDGTLPTRADSVDPELKLRVTTTDGASVDLHSVWVDSVAIRGYLVSDRENYTEDPYVVEIPLEEVEKIEERRTDLVKTALAGGAIYGGVAIVIYALAGAALLAFIAALSAGGE